MPGALLAVLALAGLAAVGQAKSLRQVGEATTASVERNLLSELSGNVSKDRLAELEAALLPMYAALPKGAGGHLGHQAVRYALHRLLLQRHGWFVVGLEPSEEALPPYLHGEWVPQYLQGLLEEHLNGRGINLHEVAALAATLEDLVRAEAADRVDRVYKTLDVAASGRISAEEVGRLLETYVMMYLDGGNFSAPAEGLKEMASYFRTDYANWADVKSWMQEILGRFVRRSGGDGLEKAAVVGMANEMGERFGAFNDRECRSLKAELLSMESQRRPGRVLLMDFYRKGLYSHWNFDEKVDYLRETGALDESDPAQLGVILPNYLAARTNCLKASTLYSVCCRNECEDLMAHLEFQIAGPNAPPHKIQELVTNLPVDALAAPPALSTTLVQRLHEIAARHGGQVPLHGRLFSQWMHHAFPRECPYPHTGTGPQTPEEWMREADGDAKASEEEVRRFLGNCTAASGCAAPAGEAAFTEEAPELPWSDEERLLVGQAPASSRAGVAWRGLRALVAFAAIVALIVAPGQLLGVRPQHQSESLDDLKKPPASTVNPWQGVLLIFAGATLLEAIGLLDRTAFTCTLGGGLLFAVVPLLVRSMKPNPKKCDHFV